MAQAYLNHLRNTIGLFLEYKESSSGLDHSLEWKVVCTAKLGGNVLCEGFGAGSSKSAAKLVACEQIYSQIIKIPSYSPANGLDRTPLSAILTMPDVAKYSPLGGIPALHIVDLESVNSALNKVNLNGPIIYFCRESNASNFKQYAGDILDTLSAFNIEYKNYRVLVDSDDSEVVDHYISACAIPFVRALNRSDLNGIVIHSIDKSAKCTEFIISKLLKSTNSDKKVELVGRNIYI